MAEAPRLPLEPPVDLRHGIVSLFRFLLAVYPAFAEMKWAWLSAHVAAGPPPGKWRVLRFEGRSDAYISAGEGGRFTSNRPADLEAGPFDMIEVPPGPHFRLREFLRSLVEQLPDSPAEARAHKQLQRQRVALLWAMGDGRLEREVLTIFREGCQERLSENGDLTAYLEQFAHDTRSRHIDFVAPGYQAGYARLVAELWSACRPSAAESATMLLAQQNKSGVPGGFSAVLLAALEGLAADADRLPGIEAALEATELHAESLEDSAVNAASVGQFFGHLYESCPHFYAAMVAYRYLQRMDPLPADKRRDFATRANACEEFFVRKLDALDTDFSNHARGGHLQGLRERVAQIRRERGEFAAHQLLREKVDLMMLYPPFWKPYLLGETEEIPTRRA